MNSTNNSDNNNIDSKTLRISMLNNDPDINIDNNAKNINKINNKSMNNTKRPSNGK
jgi:hypothetical protein